MYHLATITLRDRTPPPVTKALLLVVGLASTGHVFAQAGAAADRGFAALSARADAARDAERLDEAAALYRKALALRPSWKDGWWSLGTILYDQNAHAEAARAFGRFLSLDPKHGTAHLMLALCEYQLGQDDRALKNIRAAKDLGIANDAQLPRVLSYHEGMLLLRKGRYEEAIGALKPLVSEGLESHELHAALGMGVLMIRPKDAPTAGAPEHQVVLRAGRAERLSLAKRFDEARTSYGELVQEFPGFPNVHYAFGRFLLAVEDRERATEQFLEEIKRQPTHIRARVQIAAAHYRIDSPAGIPFAEEVVRLEPDYPFGHYLLGLLYLDAGDVSRSIPQLETAVRLVPRDPLFHFALGNAYARAGRKEDAARARAEFQRLGGTAQTPAGTPADAGEPRLKLERAPDPPP
jgi:tetratricopeptide (TPR) repeat protein